MSKFEFLKPDLDSWADKDFKTYYHGCPKNIVWTVPGDRCVLYTKINQKWCHNRDLLAWPWWQNWVKFTQVKIWPWDTIVQNLTTYKMRIFAWKLVPDICITYNNIYWLISFSMLLNTVVLFKVYTLGFRITMQSGIIV